MKHLRIAKAGGRTLLACVFFLLAVPAFAGPVTVNIVGAGDNMATVAQAAPLGDTSRAAVLQKAISANMALLPFVRQANPNSIPGGASVSAAEPVSADFQRFALAGVQLLITSYWPSPAQVEVRCYEAAGGRWMFGNIYKVGGSESELLDAADSICDDFLKSVIGNGGFFRSTLAFVKSDGARQSSLWAVKANGRNLTRLSNLRGEVLSPSWSPDGGRVIFTHIDKRSHGLGVCNVAAKTVQRNKFPGNTVIGPAYMPDGRVAVSLSDGRNPSIFLLGHGLQKERPLEQSSAIDVSPSVDATGSLMAFTSSRQGGPQIFLRDLRSGGVRRVSQAGSYNTDPSISPDGTMVAFARQMGGGHRIFVQDLVTGQERQVSFGPGSDEEPAFAPDSYFLAFMSTRSGKKEIYLTTRNGGEARRLPSGSGDASFPAWSPAR
ncbi:translocation protein TolB [Desulfovibrio sp. OttesenSCG-928-G11]|nr:translocation protein TolB [Desulfovibrio sp. OttesenSCG-928-G11]